MGIDGILLEDVRDVLRKRLHDKHPTEFPTGAAGAIVSGLAAKIFYTRQTLASASWSILNVTMKKTQLITD